jgi:hypothetical protein
LRVKNTNTKLPSTPNKKLPKREDFPDQELYENWEDLSDEAIQTYRLRRRYCSTGPRKILDYHLGWITV